MILNEVHDGVVGGHSAGKYTVHKILQAWLWWPTLHADAKEYYRSCDICQRTRKLSRCDEMPLVPQIILQEFYNWVAYFGGPINPLGKRTGARYIIIVTYYLTRWNEEAPVKDYTIGTTTKFLFDNVVT